MSNSQKRPQSTPTRRRMAYAERVLELLEKFDRQEQLAVLATAAQQINLEIGRDNLNRSYPPAILGGMPSAVPPIKLPELAELTDEG